MALRAIGAPDERQRLLAQRLQEAEEDHAAARRSTCEGVVATALDADCGRWIEIGALIATLARLIQASCIASQFCSVRPDVGGLAARISEAIDDQLDGPSWAVVDAAARLEAARRSLGIDNRKRPAEAAVAL